MARGASSSTWRTSALRETARKSECQRASQCDRNVVKRNRHPVKRNFAAVCRSSTRVPARKERGSGTPGGTRLSVGCTFAARRASSACLPRHWKDMWPFRARLIGTSHLRLDAPELSAEVAAHHGATGTRSVHGHTPRQRQWSSASPLQRRPRRAGCVGRHFARDGRQFAREQLRREAA